MAQASGSKSQTVGDLRDMAHDQVDRTAAQAQQVAQTVSKQAEAVSENVQHVATPVRVLALRTATQLRPAVLRRYQ